MTADEEGQAAYLSSKSALVEKKLCPLQGRADGLAHLPVFIGVQLHW